MKSLTDRALNLAQVQGAQYADIRVVRRRGETVVVKNGLVQDVSDVRDAGFGVRVLLNGAWGFASSSRLEAKEVDRVTAEAVRIARATALAKGKAAVLDQPRKIVASYATPVRIDPFAVPLEQKIAMLLSADAEMRAVPDIAVAEASLDAQREEKIFASTEGSYIEQDLVETGGGIEATAAGHDDVQKRSYPNSFGRQQGTGGYELISAMDLHGNARRIAEEARQLLTAPSCPASVTTLVLDATQLALQVHESCGHAVELDRVLGAEAAYAGTSFLATANMGRFRYGSDIVNIVADATVPAGLGSYGYDDEGVPAQRTPIVRNGILVGFLTSRETAPEISCQSNGAARADGWNRIPLIRMTNVNILPGTWSFEDLIADTDDGIYMQTNKSWSIDDKRLNFQFGTEIAWQIRKGKLGAMLKNATYTGITPTFWARCDAICDQRFWNVWGTPNCGKGQPPQVAHVGHGAAPARFRNVRVGLM